MDILDINNWLETVPADLIEEVESLPPDIIKILVGLNPSQLRAVMTIDGPIQINAVAGSGKTRVLTHRIAYMRYKGISPSNIMCTTYTRKATEEMHNRLSKLVPKMFMQQITLGTTHSIGYKILKKEYEAMGNPLARAFMNPKLGVLMNGRLKVFVDQTVKELMDDLSLDFEIKKELKEITRPQLTSVVAKAKNNNIDCYQYEGRYAGESARQDAYVEFYKRYEQRKLRENKIDGDDMLFLLVRLFQENEDILEKYRGYYKYILVDEGQDNNLLQYMLVKMLAEPENNLFLVGDDDQSMYGFRGARPQEFIDFCKTYKGAVQIPLEDNYRSSPSILETANSLIKNNTNRLVKTLKPHKEDTGNAVSYERYEDEDEEAKNVVEEIKNQIDNEDANPKDICVLYRTNAQSRSLEDNLIISGIPYVIHGGISFYERKEVKDVVAYLRLAVDPHHDDSFRRVINVPSRYLGRAFMDKVKNFDGSHWDAIQSFSIRFKPYETRGIDNFMQLVNDLRELNREEDVTPVQLLDHILHEGGYQDHILNEEDEDDSPRMENINTLSFVLEQYESLEGFLEYFDLMTSKAKHSVDGVQVMTIHKSKGLEFPTVFIVGASEGILPHFRSVENERSKSLPIEEERRLMYVAITRAESRCFISSIDEYNGRRTKMSRFIAELGLDLDEGELYIPEYNENTLDTWELER